MKPINAAIVGALVGGVILIVGSIAVHMVSRSIPKHEVHAVEIVETPAPIYDQAIDVCRKLAESQVGCMNFRLTPQLLNGEIEAAPVIVGGITSRISIYPSREFLDGMLDTSTGRNAYGQPVDLVAGDNWTVTILLSRGEGHELANAVQQVLGGGVLESKEG